MEKKYFLVFQTVFILNENIRWLEEFIVYYKNLGVEHFYLYDNDGSTGGDGTETLNKYNMPITTKNSLEDEKQLACICSKFPGLITLIKWQPISNGRIVYGQNCSIYHFMSNYSQYCEWTAFFDLDEFIFSVRNISIVSYLRDVPKEVGCVTLIQKKFKDRFLSKEKYITQEFSCVDKLTIGTEWAPKNIVRIGSFLSVSGIHNINVSGDTLVANIDDLRFNHYNVNEKQLSWMNGFYSRSEPFSLNGTDSSMARYADLFISSE